MALQVVFNQRVALYFSILFLYSDSGAQIEALRTVMAFAVAAVEVAKTINFSYTIPCTRVQIMWAVDPLFLVLVFASQLNF